MSAVTLATLAILKANLDVDGRDVLDMLAPLVAFSISKARLGKDFSASDVKSVVVEVLGLDLPVRAIDRILRRLGKKGQVSRDRGRYYVVEGNVDPVLFEEKRSVLLRRSADVVEGLRSFVSDEYNVSWSTEEARDALETYADSYSVDCIRASRDVSSVPVHGKSPKSASFLVSSFVNHLSLRDSRRFELLLDVVKGRMLANAVLGEDLVDQRQMFKGTTLFLDTSLVFGILGLHGAAEEHLATDVIRLGCKAGVSWGVFEHTLDEADAILRDVQLRLGGGRRRSDRGAVYRHARDAGHNASDIILMRSQLLGELQAKGVQLHPTPRHDPSRQIDELALEKEFQEAGLRHNNAAALRHDINSIRSVYRLRGHARPKALERCRAALLTQNGALARAVCAFGKRHEASRQIAAVVTEYSLANLLWLKLPLDAPDVPRHVLEAACQVALQPSEGLWSAFLVEVEKLERHGRLSPEEHAFLRYASRVEDELMALTVGDDSSLDENTVLRVLSSYQAGIVQPYEDEIKKITKQLDHANRISQKLHLCVEGAKKREVTMKYTVASWARKAGMAATWSCCLIGATLVGTGLWSPTIVSDGISGLIQRGAIATLGIVTLILSALNLVTGFTLRTPILRLSSWVERRVYGALAKRLAVNDGDEDQ